MQRRRRTSRGLAIASLVVAIGSGAIAAAAEVEPTLEHLIGTSWLAVDIDGTAVADSVRSTVTFAAADKLVGHAGCNRFFGAWSIEDGHLRMGPFGATRMACPPEMLDQETRFLAALGAVTKSEQREGELLLVEGDTVRVRLVRVEQEETDDAVGTPTREPLEPKTRR